MLDFFVIFSKGGIVLWCFDSTKNLFATSVNALVKTVILQERTSIGAFDHQKWTLKHRLDNEFDLVFVVGFQKILQLFYVDKLLDDVHREFRDKFKNDLADKMYFKTFSFGNQYQHLLSSAESWGRTMQEAPRQMRTFQQSHKSQKTVGSMIEKKSGGDNKENKKPSGKGKQKNGRVTNKSSANGTAAAADRASSGVGQDADAEEAAGTASNSDAPDTAGDPRSSNESEPLPDMVAANRRKLIKMSTAPGGAKKKGPKSPQSAAASGAVRKGKEARVWALSGSSKDSAQLDFSEEPNSSATHAEFVPDVSMVGAMAGNIQDLDEGSSDEFDGDDAETAGSSASQKTSGGGMLSMFKNLVGTKTVTREKMTPVLDQLRDHLVAKNVAIDIAKKLCDSVALTLEGRVLGTFEGVSRTVRQTLVESLMRILSPRRRVDILRDVMATKQTGRPYTMAFCGVNGVGKSTNLAKICFWLIENGFSVLIAACDTFRAGAVEQLRTHTRHLNALHPAERHGGRQMVQLYEKGYGKDPAGIANDAISHARDSGIDVVLVDTAGRMQDNEPLMRALGKLIKVNEPDLVLFVGEALVGNEAVDQLVKFNQALADYSAIDNPHTIDGIVLTKFDTIDDKVGAAISMTYVTGQPIVFVGCGQTYTDLRNLNARAVVNALMK